MLVKLTCKDNQPWYVNPNHVVSLIPTSNGATMVITDFESDYINSCVVVLEALDEVAAKLNGVSSRHFDKALAMAIEYEQRRQSPNVEAK